MLNFLRVLALALILSLFATACGGEDAGIPAADGPATSDAEDFAASDEDAAVYPVLISSERVVGENRFLVGLLDANDAPFGAPDLDVHIRFFDLAQSDSDPVEEADMDFLWTVPGERGVFVSYPTFTRTGDWGAEITVRGDGLDETVRSGFVVEESGTTPAIGAPAPPSDTPTAADVDDLAEISTDPKPTPRFYRKSVARALKDGDPFVLVFSTPKFCASAVCGPTLDEVKRVARDHRDVTFIHSEIYENLKPTNPPTQAVLDWGLPGEPWVFVVDADGNVAAKFEGVAGRSELQNALRSL
jgi:hypothetical protein